MKLKIAEVPGDGIGPEVVAQAKKVVDAVCARFGHEVEYRFAKAGACAIDEYGSAYPEETHRICMESDAVLYGAVGDPKYDNDPTAKVRPEQGLLAMRKQLGLYANLRPVETFAPLVHKSPLKEELVSGADFLCIRELTGGMYFGEKGRLDGGDTAYDTRLWRQVAQEMESQYPEVQTDYMYVDNAAMQLIRCPKFFDVIVTENTFGDILTDEASVISGSMGLLASASIGEHTGVYEPIHGSYPQAAGKNIANPLATILSAAMMFEYAFGLMEEGRAIREAVAASIDAGFVTEDLAGEGVPARSTSEVGDWVADYIRNA